MGKKGKKKKGGGKEKTEKKTVKKAEKREKQRQKAEGEDDIEQLVRELEKQEFEARHLQVQSNAEPPSPRTNATWTLCAKRDEIILHGGEYFDGARTNFFNDTYLFHLKSRAWTRLHGPAAPPARSSHQACVTHYGGEDFLYIFGGEFANPQGSQFHHFGDMWRLKLGSAEWERVEHKGPDKKGKAKAAAPSPRSGHRMLVWKQKILLFGGFYEAARGTKYYNDTWLFDPDAARWTELKEASTSLSPRSGCQLQAHGDGVYLFGGFYKDTSRGADNETGVVYSDVWHLKPGVEHAQWEKVKLKGLTPQKRSGFCMCSHKERRAVLFGGVTDEDLSGASGEEDGQSMFHNDLWVFDMNKRRWFPLVMKKPKTTQPEPPSHPQQRPAAGAGASSSADAGPADAEDPDDDMASCEANTPEDPMDLVFRDVPHPRFGASIAISGNKLVLYGGMLEAGERDVTFDDVWMVDIQKMNEWECIYEGTVDTQQWKGVIEKADEDDGKEDADEDEEDEDEEEEEEEEDEGDGGQAVRVRCRGGKGGGGKDYSWCPKPEESLKSFWERTANRWTGKILESGQFGGKTLRRQAFQLAQTRYVEEQEKAREPGSEGEEDEA